MTGILIHGIIQTTGVLRSTVGIHLTTEVITACLVTHGIILITSPHGQAHSATTGEAHGTTDGMGMEPGTVLIMEITGLTAHMRDTVGDITPGTVAIHETSS